MNAWDELDRRRTEEAREHDTRVVIEGDDHQHRVAEGLPFAGEIVTTECGLRGRVVGVSTSSWQGPGPRITFRDRRTATCAECSH